MKSLQPWMLCRHIWCNARTGQSGTGSCFHYSIDHQLSMVCNADKIFVIQESQLLVEEGSHTQLLTEKPNGAYAALISRHLEAQEKLRCQFVGGTKELVIIFDFVVEKVVFTINNVSIDSNKKAAIQKITKT